jgi:hypothetical protein
MATSAAISIFGVSSIALKYYFRVTGKRHRLLQASLTVTLVATVVLCAVAPTLRQPGNNAESAPGAAPKTAIASPSHVNVVPDPSQLTRSQARQSITQIANGSKDSNIGIVNGGLKMTYASESAHNLADTKESE